MQQSIHSRSAKRFRAVAVSLIASLGLSLFALSSADAASVRGGETTVKINGAVAKKLKNSKIKVKAGKPAKKRGNSVRLKFKKGNFVVTTNNPAPYEPLAVENITGQGTLRGAIVFRAGSRSAKITGLKVNLKKRQVIGKVQGKRAVVFKINIAWATPEGTALRPRLTAAPIKLTAKAARRLNARLGRNVFSSRGGFGQLNVAPVLAG